MILTHMFAKPAGRLVGRLFVLCVGTAGALGAQQDPDRPLELGIRGSAPRWSPDGRLIAYSAPEPGAPADSPHEIWVASADGVMIRRLTTHTADDRNPAWSPDGGRVVFSSEREMDRRALYVVGTADGLVRLLASGERSYDEPDWSWSTGDIAIAAGGDILSLTPTGKLIRRLTASSARDHEPRWSPDGTRVVFARGETPDTQLFVVGRDGSGEVPRTVGQFSTDPTWSADGDVIAFVRAPPSLEMVRLNLYTMLSDGSEVQPLNIVSTFNDLDPDFSPNGWLLVYSRGGTLAIVNVKSGPSQVGLETWGQVKRRR